MPKLYNIILSVIIMNCHYSCATCSANVYMFACLSCPATRYLLDSTCICSSGYYEGQQPACYSSSRRLYINNRSNNFYSDGTANRGYSVLHQHRINLAVHYCHVLPGEQSQNQNCSELRTNYSIDQQLSSSIGSNIQAVFMVCICIQF